MSEQRIKLSGIQRKIARKMSESKKIIPHVTTIREIKMDKVVNLRGQLKNELEDEIEKLSFMPFILKAVADAIKDYPLINSSYNEEENELIIKNDINIGFAVSVEDKLLVPVVKNIESISFIELANKVNEITELCRDKKISPKDMRDGTFTVTNSGSLGGEIFTPIINYPESAILGVGKIQKKPIVDENNNIVACPMMFICLSYDHRIINGAVAVKFLGKIEENLAKEYKEFELEL